MNMTRDEIERLSEALKKEEFRKLLVEYAEEISDPANRQLYEREISKLEEERGMNVTFIHPEPGYCVKTSQNGAKKCFVNICKNEHIEKPVCKRDGAGVGGAYWQIPHSCSPARDDLDTSDKSSCVVYDVVFNPDAYRMGETNQRFNKLLIDSAFETIENNFRVKLDKVNYKVLKNLKFKGKPTACVIRKSANETQQTPSSKPQTESSPPADDDSIGRLIDQLKDEYMQEQTKTTSTKPAPSPAAPKPTQTPQVIEENYVKPEYKMVHRGQIDMQDYVSSHNVTSTRPKELIITVELPMCKSSENLIVDIFEKRLYLESSKPNYRLDLNLPYPINEKEAKAKFDKSKRCLNLTLPVVPFVAKLDIVNVDHLSDEEDTDHSSSSSNFSPSSSSSSDSNLELVSSQIQNAAQNKESELVQPATNVMYKLPNTIRLSEYRDHVLLTVTAANYQRGTLDIKQLSPCEVRVQFESVSRSAYTQYYLMYVTFTHDEQKLNILSSDESQLKPIYVDEDTFQVMLKKNGPCDQTGKKALVSDEHSDELDMNNNSASNSTPIVVNIDENSRQSEFVVPEQPVPTEEMSKREFILNFDKMVRKDDADEDDDDDDVNEENENGAKEAAKEEEDDEEDQEQQSKSKFKNLSEEVKLAKQKFVKSVDKNELLDEEENDDDEHANESHSESDNEDNDDDEHATKPRFDLNCDGLSSRSSSISNFTNDSSNLSSSLNSASFSKLKVIINQHYTTTVDIFI